MNRKFVLSKKYLEKKQDDNLLIFVEELSSYIKLENTSLFIWEMLKKPISFSKIVNAVTDEFKIEKSVAEKDIKYFIKNLLKENFVKEIKR